MSNKWNLQYVKKCLLRPFAWLAILSLNVDCLRKKIMDKEAKNMKINNEYSPIDVSFRRELQELFPPPPPPQKLCRINNYVKANSESVLESKIIKVEMEAEFL
ncbi:hypothetical protein HZC34_04015 [Candidatus Saganbacteria bacterium]|nr:hypothetical protein [Candidatus Saganbacteria bacterium]